jgi:serine/threonine-protein kinase
MSPEQCRGRDVDHRTDLYAFGVLAYRMITGRYPLDADDYMSILIRQLSDTPEPASRVVPEIPKGVDEALAWLMAKDPARRPPDVRSAVAAIGEAAQEAGIVVSAAWDVQSGSHGRVGTQPTLAATARGSGSASAVGAGEARARAKAKARRRAFGVLVALLALVAGVAAMLITIKLREPEAAEAAAPAQAAPVAAPAAATAAAAPAAAATAAAAAAAPAAPEQPQPPPPPQQPAPAVADHVIVTITGVPDGTEVSIGTTPVGVAPGPVQLPRGARAVVLTFKAAGHVPASRTLTPDQDRSLALALKRRVAAPAGPKQPGKDDIINVFDP